MRVLIHTPAVVCCTLHSSHVTKARCVDLAAHVTRAPSKFPRYLLPVTFGYPFEPWKVICKRSSPVLSSSPPSSLRCVVQLCMLYCGALPPNRRRMVVSSSNMSLHFMITVTLVWMRLSIANAATISSITSYSVDQCRELGFDPFQLSCDTCEKLSSWLKDSSTSTSPSSNDNQKQPSVVTAVTNCLSCCQVYRDLPRAQPQRYQAAILVHATGQNEHLDNLIENDKFEETVKKIKGSNRFRRVEVPVQAAMMIPSHLYWLDQVLDESKQYDLSGMEQYEAKSKETVTLDPSWKTDDIRDMILTLLADK